jgi:hypothetical protein
MIANNAITSIIVTKNIYAISILLLDFKLENKMPTPNLHKVIKTCGKTIMVNGVLAHT